MALALGTRLGPYEILAPLGAGGMGEVYRARDKKLDRDVAIKVLPQVVASDPRTLARFEREAKAVAALSHPNVLSIFDFGAQDGVSYAVMELLEGETLRGRLDAGPIPQKQAVDYALQIVKGLSAAHGKGVIHRDLKPENLFVTRDAHLKILDFGLAKREPPVAQGEETGEATVSGHTEPGTVMGTVSYMSPEQVRGLPVDHRSDIFSFGAILYELLSGKRAFKRDTASDTIAAILMQEPPEPSESGRNIPPALDNIVRHCLEKDRDNRFQSAKDIAFALSEQSSQTVAAGARPAAPPTGRGKVLIAGTVPLVLAAAAWWFYGTGHGARSAAAGAQRPQSVLIADFENRTGERIFEGTLESSLGLAMEGASFVTNYDRGQARKIAARLQPGSNGLTEALGRLVAVREGINVVTAGTIEKGGDGYRISVRAVDASSGKPVTTQTLDASNKEEVLQTIARLAAKVRQGMGDATPVSLQLAAAETFTAGSLEASHEYAEAQDDQSAGKYDEAAKHYLKAVELDQQLGRAYAGLGAIYGNQGRRDEAEKYYTRALALIDHMTDREKRRTRGGYYLIVRRDPDKAIEEYGQLVQHYPADTAAIANLALAHFYKRDMARALSEGRKAIAIYPKNVPQRNNVGLYAMYGGDFATAIQEQRQVLEMNPRFVLGYVGLALSQFGEGHPQEAISTYERASSISEHGASAATAGLADVALYQGRADEAIAILQKGVAADLAWKRPDSAAVKLAMLAETHLLRGDKGAAVAAADRAVSLSKGENVLHPAARVYLEASREPKALALAKDLSERLDADSRAYAELIRGEAESMRGKPREAVSLFEGAKKIADTWAGRLDLGKAYLAMGAFPEAYEQLETCVMRRGEATAMFLDESPTYHVFPPVYYYLGRAQEGVKSPAAAESYRAFLAIKKDGEDPLVADTRHRLTPKAR